MATPENHLGLLLIDLQDTFLKLIPDRNRLLQRVSFAVEAATLLGCSISITEQSPEKLGSTTPTIKKLVPDTTPLFAKQSFSAMAAKGIDRWIEDNQIDHLLLLGIETPICIYQTAIQAFDHIGITVLSDCISERRFEDREPTLRQLLAMEVNVLPSETIFYSLLSSASHSHFRTFTQLVKKYS